MILLRLELELSARGDSNLAGQGDHQVLVNLKNHTRYTVDRMRTCRRNAARKFENRGEAILKSITIILRKLVSKIGNAIVVDRRSRGRSSLSSSRCRPIPVIEPPGAR